MTWSLRKEATMVPHRTHIFTLPNRLRVFNKYVTNRLLRVFAKVSLGPFALIRHVGRRSGKPYETVIWAWRLGEGFVIALTYGPEVGWYHNMRAAGGGTLVWHAGLCIDEVVRRRASQGLIWHSSA
jgi:hypothetical protein